MYFSPHAGEREGDREKGKRKEKEVDVVCIYILVYVQSYVYIYEVNPPEPRRPVAVVFQRSLICSQSARHL